MYIQRDELRLEFYENEAIDHLTAMFKMTTTTEQKLIELVSCKQIRVDCLLPVKENFWIFHLVAFILNLKFPYANGVRRLLMQSTHTHNIYTRSLTRFCSAHEKFIKIIYSNAFGKRRLSSFSILTHTLCSWLKLRNGT